MCVCRLRVSSVDSTAMAYTSGSSNQPASEKSGAPLMPPGGSQRQPELDKCKHMARQIIERSPSDYKDTHAAKKLEEVLQLSWQQDLGKPAPDSKTLRKAAVEAMQDYRQDIKPGSGARRGQQPSEASSGASSS